MVLKESISPGMSTSILASLEDGVSLADTSAWMLSEAPSSDSKSIMLLTLKIGCWPFEGGEGLASRSSNPVELKSGEEEDDVKFMIPIVSLYDFLSAASTRCLKLS